jgi:hypothetical protein
MYNIEEIEDFNDANSFDAYDGIDSFDSYNAIHERVSALPAISLAQRMAKQRRMHGHAQLAKIGTFETQAQRKSELSGRPVEDIYLEMLRNNPHRIEQIKDYIHRRGFTPASNIEDLAVQAAKARHMHVIEVQETYDPSAWDADNFIFDSKERKAMRKRRRKAKWARREKRRQMREDAREAKIQKKIDEANQREAPEDAQPHEDPNAVKSQTTYNPNEKVYQSTDTNTTEVQELGSPTQEDAHAEIIGEEMEMESFYGEDEADNFLPFLAGAINIGAKLLSGGQVGKDDLAKLMAKKSPTDEAKTLTKTDTATALNQGIKKIMDTVETQKKKEFLKENIIWILLAVVVIFLIGYKLAK